MKVRRIVILVVVLLLIIGFEVFLMNRLSRPDTASVPEPTAEPEATQEPVAPVVPQPVQTDNTPGSTSPPAPPVVNLPTATQAPAATAAPTNAPTPAPTEAPTPAPTAPPSDVTTGSGGFSSDTGTSLNLSVDWTAVDHGDGTATVTITGSVVSYELHVMAQSVSISFGGYSASCTGSSIDYSGGGMSVSHLFSTSMTVPSGTEGNMSVTWNYNGVYNEIPLSSVTASGYAYT